MTPMMKLGAELRLEMDAGLLKGYCASHNLSQVNFDYDKAINTITTRENPPRVWVFNYYGTIEYPAQGADLL